MDFPADFEFCLCVNECEAEVLSSEFVELLVTAGVADVRIEGVANNRRKSSLLRFETIFLFLIDKIFLCFVSKKFFLFYNLLFK